MSTNVKKNANGYGYKYTDLAEIHSYLEANNMRYYQYTERIEGDDYIFTVPIIEGKEQSPRRGCRVVQATLKGVNNPAQEQGSALTYARRYSVLMAFGLATTDDDAQCLSTPKQEPTKPQKKQVLAQNDKAMELMKVAGSKEEALNILKFLGLKDGCKATPEQIDEAIKFLKETKADDKSNT